MDYANQDVMGGGGGGEKGEEARKGKETGEGAYCGAWVRGYSPTTHTCLNTLRL